jgi:hypothetical protein
MANKPLTMEILKDLLQPHQDRIVAEVRLKRANETLAEAYAAMKDAAQALKLSDPGDPDGETGWASDTSCTAYCKLITAMLAIRGMQ